MALTNDETAIPLQLRHILPFQIKLFQGAANAYNIPPDPLFDRWFDSVLVLDDREAYQLSCQIEPPSNGSMAANQGTTSRDVRQKRKPG